MKLSVFRQQNNTLKAAYNSDHEKIMKLKLGSEYEVSVKLIRNPVNHRRFFALIKMVYENQDVFINIEHLREELTKAAGFYDTYINHKGAVCYKAKSIAFDKMDEDEFSELYNRFKDAIIDNFQFDGDDIENNIDQYF